MTSLVLSLPWVGAIVVHFLVAHFANGIRDRWGVFVSYVNAAAAVSAAITVRRTFKNEAPSLLEGLQSVPFLMGVTAFVVAYLLLRAIQNDRIAA